MRRRAMLTDTTVLTIGVIVIVIIVVIVVITAHVVCTKWRLGCCFVVGMWCLLVMAGLKR